jgi:hypothetical protein
MKKYLSLILFLVCVHISTLFAEENFIKKQYKLKADPIDVVFVSHPKDKKTLELAIDGIRKNCEKVRRVIVISSECLTNKAEWVDEADFPFNKKSILRLITGGDKAKIEEMNKSADRGPGWYLQQLLKLYSPFIIPGISSNVLVIDADTIFMNPVSFLNDSNGGLFCVSQFHGNSAYFEHAKRLVPDYKRIHPEVYSVCHHMLFQKAILQDLFKTVEAYHGKPFWKAFCLCVNLPKGKRSGASEYEIYYNFALSHTDQVEIRPLTWNNSSEINRKNIYKNNGYHFISFHTYLQDKKS